MAPSPLLALIEEMQLPPEEAARRAETIQNLTIDTSPYLDVPNFNLIHDNDLQNLFTFYDHMFFDGRCRELLGERRLDFRLSERMTRSAGKTSFFRSRTHLGHSRFEIAISSTLLYSTFEDVERTVTVNGIVCHHRMGALQRIMEHEIVHLIEFLLWEKSSCTAGRFQSIANRFFGHTDHRHSLITQRERAARTFGLRIGQRVRFEYDGQVFVGVINRFTRRATVLVEHPQGRPFSDGKRYETFYVPVEKLEAVD